MDMDESVRQIFISYSRKDEKWQDMIEDFFAPLVRQRVVRIWHDKLINTGGRFEEQIFRELEASHLAILLVSPAFLASDFISTKELPKILERWQRGELLIAPILLSDCLWRYTDLANVQFAHDVSIPLLYLTEKDLNHELAKIVGGIINLLGVSRPKFQVSPPTSSSRPTS
jgi:hypothetical protein